MYTFKSIICMILCIAPFCCTVLFSNATSPSSVIILDEMKSDRGVCIFPSDDLYNNLELLTMCDLRLVNHKNISEYLKVNFVPLLCMSLYDVSLRLCDLTILHPELKVKIPQTVQDFNVWETDIEKSEEYSSIGKFCSTAAIHSGNLLDRIKGVTAEWINYFNTNLKNETVCKRVCQPSGLSTNPDGVHPFCSFIIWSNNLYSATITKSETNGVKNDEAKKNDEGNEERPDEITPFNVDGVGATGGQSVKGLEFIPTGKQPELSPTHGIDILEHPQSKDMKPVEETYVQNSNSPKYNLNLKSKNDESMPNPKNITYVQIPISDIKKKPNDKLSNEPTHQGRESENKYLTEVKKESETDIETVNVSKEAHKPSTLNEAQLSDPITSLSQSDKTEKEPNVPELKESDNVEQAENPLPEDEEFIHNNEDPIKASEDENQDDNDYQAPPPKENVPPKLQNEELSKDKDEYIVKDGFIEAEDSHFFTNFMSLAVLCIIAYLVFHNKKKLLALVVEGKRRGPARRRPNTASYSKLDCNLEEAMVSNTTASVTHVLY